MCSGCCCCCCVAVAVAVTAAFFLTAIFHQWQGIGAIEWRAWTIFSLPRRLFLLRVLKYTGRVPFKCFVPNDDYSNQSYSIFSTYKMRRMRIPQSEHIRLHSPTIKRKISCYYVLETLSFPLVPYAASTLAKTMTENINQQFSSVDVYKCTALHTIWSKIKIYWILLERVWHILRALSMPIGAHSERRLCYW